MISNITPGFVEKMGTRVPTRVTSKAETKSTNNVLTTLSVYGLNQKDLNSLLSRGLFTNPLAMEELKLKEEMRKYLEVSQKNILKINK